MNKIEPGIGINRRYLHDEVADRMRELIHSGEMEPKARVNESELTERFGISRTPLREAIKILATEGLLELLPNRGARVASISQTEIEEMIEVIAGLEATACDLACRTITDAEIAAIEAKHAAMVSAWTAREEAEYFRLNREIHEDIMQASRNATLQSIYAGLSGRTQRSRYRAHQTDEQWARAVEEHEGMIPRLQARDGEGLAKLMREHIRAKKPVIAATYGELLDVADLAV
ncbi:GntR family transcriptional regulator [Methylobacterium haplocladii]|uniref:Transcriptional regulator n=1 Tax=Methylobacterium haplocladii TaxID=1176176 RepID=A0A512IUQ1_9HYPH|nr:GntR family transcriptional regulator [Methylobacterium haplocladii]GEP01442.1 transcriptional regulator [Methylobacterium haplocladii]GJD84986.1 HTH-type transcriptional repressor RspR [Methylobacterium haplocladii]GLS59615.1 transcriptional regulator [Methylobacterium haplocladii]